MFGLFFTAQQRVDNFGQTMACDAQAFRDFFSHMLESGVYLAPSAFEAGFMSSAHTHDHIQTTLMASERAFAAMRQQ